MGADVYVICCTQVKNADKCVCDFIFYSVFNSGTKRGFKGCVLRKRRFYRSDMLCKSAKPIGP